MVRRSRLSRHFHKPSRGAAGFIDIGKVKLFLLIAFIFLINFIVGKYIGFYDGHIRHSRYSRRRIGLDDLLRILCEHYVMTGFIALCAVIAAVYAWHCRSLDKRSSWSTARPKPLSGQGQTGARPRPGPAIDSALLSGTGISEVRAGLRQLQVSDPTFSRAVFEEFLRALYAGIQRASVHGCEPILPYIAPHLVLVLRRTGLADIDRVRIASLQFRRVAPGGDGSFAIDVIVQASLREVGLDGSHQTLYRKDRLKLFRAAGVRSRALDQAKSLDCPNCGSAFQALQGTICAHCRSDVGGGRFDWCLTHLIGEGCDAKGPLIDKVAPAQVAGRQSEVAPGAQARFEAICQRDPSQSWACLCERIRHIWREVRSALANRTAEGVRSVVTDGQFEALLYWIEHCLARRCSLISAAAHIERIELIDVVSDALYDAVTVRLFVSGCEFTLADDGRILSGSRIHPRDSSEYWTLIRGQACQGNAADDAHCPRCGENLHTSPAGRCAHCQAWIASGEFNWILSRRESIENYRG